MVSCGARWATIRCGAGRNGIGTATGATAAPGWLRGAAMAGSTLCGLAACGGIGAITWLEPLNASMMDSDITIYIDSATTETAYITTKKASSSVIRSA